MVELATQKEFRAVRSLPFCYLCGKAFQASDIIDRDHVPPRRLFAKTDRQPALILKSHAVCNSAQGDFDNKMGQLLKLKRGEVPTNPKDRILDITLFTQQFLSAVTNVDIDQAVWRWVRGFHAALYSDHLADSPYKALVTPFQRGQQSGLNFTIESVKPQHLEFVKAIKTNRALNNIDRIRSNNGKVTYECVWVRMQAQDASPWGCVFALDLYDWKDLGAPELGHRGCAGCYLLSGGTKPQNGAEEIISRIILPNYDPLDPFGR